MKLSVLILTVPNRVDSDFKSLVDNVIFQSKDQSVEVLGLFDNKKISVGRKRDILLSLAQGDFFVFIDDDDEISGDFISYILSSIDKEPDSDCIVFDSLCYWENRAILCKYGIEYDVNIDKSNDIWYIKPSHCMIWRTDLVRHISFGNSNYGEDATWIAKAFPLIKKQTRINKVLHYYNLNIEKSETTDGIADSIAERITCADPVLFSVLVPTLPSRLDKFGSLVLDLSKQAEQLPVEIIGFLDNKTRSVGAKRNALLSMVSGSFFAFVDDDDRVSEEYVEKIVTTLEQSPDVDCVTYTHVINQVDKGYSYFCRRSKEFTIYTEDRANGNCRSYPSHTCTWRTSIGKIVNFPNVIHGEDAKWSSIVKGLINKEIILGDVLYYYNFDPNISETKEMVREKKCCGKAKYKAVPRKYANPIECSIVISTRNKGRELNNTLFSIFRQQPGLTFEVIIVDDGSTDDTEIICRDYISQKCNLSYIRLDNDSYRNPGIARNVGYKKARGNVIIAQSDEVVHGHTRVISQLCDIVEGTFNIAKVYDCVLNNMNLLPFPKQQMKLYTGKKDGRPLFFLGSLLREHIYAIGGNDEDFKLLGYDDDWFGKCLIRGLGLRPNFREDVIGYHQRHKKYHTKRDYDKMKLVWEDKVRQAGLTGIWRGGEPWPLV